MARRAVVRVQVIPKFPSQVVAGEGIDIEQSGGVYTISATANLPADIEQGGILYGSDTDELSVLDKDTNATRYLSNTGTDNNPAWAQVALATGVSGTLPVANGGTGLASFQIGDILYASDGTTIAGLADIATGNALISGGVAAAPSWGKIDLTAHITGDLPFANLTQGAALTVLANATNGTADFAAVAAGTDHQVFRRSGTALAFGAVNLAQAAAVTGTLAVGNGGTGITSLGTGVATALGVNVGSAGAVIVNGGALGSPSSAGTLPAFTLGGTIAGGGNQLNNIIIGTSTPLAGAFTTLAAAGTITVTSSSASALTVGRQGATDPALRINAAAATSVTGLTIISQAAAGGVGLAAISSGTNEPLTIDAKGSGTITIGAISTGTISLARDIAVTGTISQNGALISQAGFPIYKTTVNFNTANTDYPITITLPSGYTRYQVGLVIISGASASLTTATSGLFTAAAGAGTAIVAGGSAITVSSAAENTVNNSMAMTLAVGTTQTFNAGTLFWRVATAQGSAATGTVTVFLRLVS